MNSKVEEAIRSLLVPVCDVYDEPNAEENQIWEPKFGDPILIKEMTDSHLFNSLRWWRDWYRPTFYRYSGKYSNEEEFLKFDAIRQGLKGKELEAFDKYMENIGHTRSMHLNLKYKYLWQEALKRGGLGWLPANCRGRNADARGRSSDVSQLCMEQKEVP